MVNGVDGLISGIPTGELIDSLVDLGRGRARQLEARKVEAEARLELVRSYNLRLLSAKLDLGELSRDSLYEGRSLSSSNEAAVTGTASSSAQSGSVTFSVDQLAEAHELATEGQASSTSDIGAGDITLQVGNGQQVTVSMGASDSSLDDIAAAINQADAGVSAYVINDGGANPYRLVLQGQDTGKDNTISVSATGAMALSDLFDQGGLALTELTAAANAEITLGTSGSLTIESATNQVSGVVPGVTLDLHETASRVTISVGQETEPVKERIMTFVESMNAAIEFLNLTTSYDPATNDAGLLIGDSDLRQGMNRMIRELTQAVPGLDGKNTLSAIGITLDRQDGTLQVDEGKLDGVLASDPDAVRNIFNNSGVSSDPGVSFATVSTKTDVSNPFAIEITQAASRAAVSTYQDVQTSGGLVTISDGVNDQLSLSAGGTSVSLQLAAGDYTTQALADHLQALVDAEFTGSSKMSVVMDGDRLALESVSFGGSRSIIVGASSATATLGLDTGTFTGSDVAGTIDGEVASGAGRVLSGVEGSASDGLRVVVDADTPVSGVTMDVRRGIAERVEAIIAGFTDSIDGTLVNRENSYTAQIEDIDTQVGKIDERLELRRAGLQAQFLNMERLLAQFQSQESFLNSQLNAINNMNVSQANRGK